MGERKFRLVGPLLNAFYAFVHTAAQPLKFLDPGKKGAMRQPLETLNRRHTSPLGQRRKPFQCRIAVPDTLYDFWRRKYDEYTFPGRLGTDPIHCYTLRRR